MTRGGSSSRGSWWFAGLVGRQSLQCRGPTFTGRARALGVFVLAIVLGVVYWGIAYGSETRDRIVCRDMDHVPDAETGPFRNRTVLTCVALGADLLCYVIC